MSAGSLSAVAKALKAMQSSRAIQSAWRSSRKKKDDDLNGESS